MPVRLAHRIAATRGEFGCVREVPAAPATAASKNASINSTATYGSVPCGLGWRPAERTVSHGCPDEAAYTLVVNRL